MGQKVGQEEKEPDDHPGERRLRLLDRQFRLRGRLHGELGED